MPCISHIPVPIVRVIDADGSNVVFGLNMNDAGRSYEKVVDFLRLFHIVPRGNTDTSSAVLAHAVCRDAAVCAVLCKPPLEFVIHFLLTGFAQFSCFALPLLLLLLHTSGFRRRAGDLIAVVRAHAFRETSHAFQYQIKLTIELKMFGPYFAAQVQDVFRFFEKHTLTERKVGVSVAEGIWDIEPALLRYPAFYFRSLLCSDTAILRMRPLQRVDVLSRMGDDAALLRSNRCFLGLLRLRFPASGLFLPALPLLTDMLRGLPAYTRFELVHLAGRKQGFQQDGDIIGAIRNEQDNAKVAEHIGDDAESLPQRDDQDESRNVCGQIDKAFCPLIFVASHGQEFALLHIIRILFVRYDFLPLVRHAAVCKEEGSEH